MLRLNNLSRLSIESRRFDSVNDVLSVEEQQNVCGSKCRRAKAWLVFCLLPPRSASRTAVGFCFPSKADHDSDVVFYKAKESCYLPSHCVHPLSHVVGSIIWLQCITDKKMSLITTWFHNIQIFVLFIYYIY